MEFTLRGLKSEDLFRMFTILSKIGFKDLKKSLNPDKLKELLTTLKSEDKDVNTTTIFGFNIVFEVVDAVLQNLPACEKDIYSFLASLSGQSAKEIADLDLVTFTEMIVAVVQKEEFKDFFKVVAKLFN